MNVRERRKLVLDGILGVARDGMLACRDALSLASRLGVPPGLVGKVCNEEGIRIVDCQLGCFGRKTKRKASATLEHQERGLLPAGARVRFNVWIEDEQGRLLYGRGRQEILEAVARSGSLSAASDALGMSYRGLWARLRNSESRLGMKLVESHAGRGPDSGTSVTEQASELMERFSEFEKAVAESIGEAFQRAFGDKKE